MIFFLSVFNNALSKRYFPSGFVRLITLRAGWHTYRSHDMRGARNFSINYCDVAFQRPPSENASQRRRRGGRWTRRGMLYVISLQLRVGHADWLLAAAC